MLLELRVENLLLIERAELRLGPGLNVVTGETGAGKSVLAQALELLLGARPRPGIVRPGAAEAWVEAVVDRPPDLPLELAERLPADEEEIVLARRVSAEGRSRAFLGGRSCAVGDLAEVTAAVLAFHGQHETRRLLTHAAQLDLLDGFGGRALRELRAEHAAALGGQRARQAELDELRRAAGDRERELDVLRFELGEIDEVAPTPDERDELAARRERLRHVEALRAGVHTAGAALEDEDGGALTALNVAEASLEALAGVDPALDVHAARLRALRIEADDLASELRSALDELTDDPGELERTEERLQAIGRLERKHGGTVEAVLAHADAARERLAALEDVEGATERAEAALAEAAGHRAAIAADLRARRAALAPELGRAVAERLDGLAMPGARFVVDLAERDAGPTGEDRVELLLAPNPGVPEAPVREAASGGELSRVMLALLAVAGAEGDGPRVAQLFDEIDAGVGGQTARAVGEELRALGDGGQVLVITHLPQIAALADRHFALVKDTTVEPARTAVRALGEEEVTAELVRMLGAPGDDEAARRHAQELQRAG